MNQCCIGLVVASGMELAVTYVRNTGESMSSSGSVNELSAIHNDGNSCTDSYQNRRSSHPRKSTALELFMDGSPDLGGTRINGRRTA